MSVTINLIRDMKTNEPQTDDLVTIVRKGDNILVSYKDRQNGVSSKQRLVLGKNDLSRYIQNLGHLFLTDKQPFAQAQFNFPGFPSFLVDQKSLQNTDTQDSLMEIADLVSSSWFLEDDYSDMPPLVSATETHRYDTPHRYTNEPPCYVHGSTGPAYGYTNHY
jgi:hypothetical protein